MVSLDDQSPLFIVDIATDSLKSGTLIVVALKHATYSLRIFFFLLNKEESI